MKFPFGSIWETILILLSIFDEHYIYQAIVTSPPKFTGTRKKAGFLIPFEFTVSIRPFKKKIVLANIG